MNMNQILAEMQRIIEYCWVEEMEDYREPEMRSPDHIFHSLVRVNNALNGLNETPDELVGELTTGEKETKR